MARHGNTFAHATWSSSPTIRALKLNARHDGKIMRMGVAEIMTASVGAREFGVASAKSFEGKLGSTEFSLSETQRAAVREFAH